MDNIQLQTTIAFSERLRDLLKSHKINRSDFSRGIQRSLPSISHYITEDTRPTVDAVIRMCEIFGVSADFLVLGRENRGLLPLNADTSSFADRLARAIKYKGIRKNELARKINRSPQAITRYIQGTSIPAFDVLARIAENLTVSLDYLLMNRGKGELPPQIKNS